MDLIGHKQQLELLRKARSMARLAHAYVFTGPDGVGKKLAALLFAKETFCTSAGPRPCDECPQCKKVESMNHPDLIMISAEKKDITIDQTRQMQSSIQKFAMEGPCKIVIIDEAERMNSASANSLLKTLEEPPKDTYLFLITSRPHMLPPTIISRCQRISFSPLPTNELVTYLVSRDIDNKTAAILAGISGGSIGMALSFPADVIGDVVSAVEGVWGGAQDSDILEVAQRWSAFDTNSVLAILLGIYRDIALLKNANILPLFSSMSKAIENESEKLSPSVIQENIAIIKSAQADADTTYNKQLLFEELLFKLAGSHAG